MNLLLLKKETIYELYVSALNILKRVRLAWTFPALPEQQYKAVIYTLIILIQTPQLVKLTNSKRPHQGVRNVKGPENNF